MRKKIERNFDFVYGEDGGREKREEGERGVFGRWTRVENGMNGILIFFVFHMNA